VLPFGWRSNYSPLALSGRHFAFRPNPAVQGNVSRQSGRWQDAAPQIGFIILQGQLAEQTKAPRNFTPDDA
jgi:hypothetical protein